MVSRKNFKSVCLCTDCKIFQFNGTVQNFFWELRKLPGASLREKFQHVFKFQHSVYKFKARMESFKSFGNVLQFLIGDWRHREKSKTSGVEKTQLKSPKVNTQGT